MKKTFIRIGNFLSKIVPVKKNLVLLESNPTFSDNTLGIYNELLKLKDNKLQIIWMTFDSIKSNDSSVNQFYYDSSNLFSKVKSRITLIWLHLRAEYYFFSHRNNMIFTPKKSQFVVNLTHGTPIKNSIGRHHSQDNVTHIISSSNLGKKLEIETFECEESKIHVTGFPRNDVFYSGKSKKRQILWLPTYRTHKNEMLDGENDFFPLSPTDSNLKNIDDLLVETDFELIIKPHPAQKLSFKFDKLSNIKMISDLDLQDNKTNLYNMLSETSILITDYSSVYADFILMDSPVIFTFDDLNQYEKEWGFLVNDIKSYTPGHQITDIDQLYRALEEIIVFGEDRYKQKRNELKFVFNQYDDANNALRVLKLVKLVTD